MYVIQNIQTGDYIEAGDPKRITTARTFNSTGAAHSCRSYVAHIHQLVPVELIAVPGADPIRNGEWLTLQEMWDKFPAVEWKEGETFLEPNSQAIRPLTIVFPPKDAPKKLFQVKNKTVFQCVYFDIFGRTQTKMCEIYPTKPLHRKHW
jgi:hypothetical protein